MHTESLRETNLPSFWQILPAIAAAQLEPLRQGGRVAQQTS
jgi:hypothetical protein